jgi:hypothetical protein
VPSTYKVGIVFEGPDKSWCGAVSRALPETTFSEAGGVTTATAKIRARALRPLSPCS